MRVRNVTRIGTRSSRLAVAQARLVQRALNLCQVSSPIMLMDSDGDLIHDRSIQEIGGKGIFVRRLDRALLGGDFDVGVHSLKDVEAALTPGTQIGAVVARTRRNDAIVFAPHIRSSLPTLPHQPNNAHAPSISLLLQEVIGRCPWLESDTMMQRSVHRVLEVLSVLPMGARVGTSSPRRTALLRCLRPDFEVFPIRGNINTRLAKLAMQDEQRHRSGVGFDARGDSPRGDSQRGDSQRWDAIVIALCGMDRLGIVHQEKSVLLDGLLDARFDARFDDRWRLDMQGKSGDMEERRNGIHLSCELLDADVFVPACGQGVIAAVARHDDTLTKDRLSLIGDAQMLLLATLERSFVEHIGGGCYTSLGVCAQWSGNEAMAVLRVAVLAEDGSMARWEQLRVPSVRSVQDAYTAGALAAETIATSIPLELARKAHIGQWSGVLRGDVSSAHHQAT